MNRNYKFALNWRRTIVVFYKKPFEQYYCARFKFTALFVYLGWICYRDEKISPACLAEHFNNSGQTDAQVDANFGLEFNLRFFWPSTCVDFGPAQIRTQVAGMFLNYFFFTSWSQVIRICVKFTTLSDLRELASHLTTHRKSVRKFWLVNLRRFASTCESIGQDFGVTKGSKIKWYHNTRQRQTTSDNSQQLQSYVHFPCDILEVPDWSVKLAWCGLPSAESLII